MKPLRDRNRIFQDANYRGGSFQFNRDKDGNFILAKNESKNTDTKLCNFLSNTLDHSSAALNKIESAKIKKEIFVKNVNGNKVNKSLLIPYPNLILINLWMIH